jgi:hypothetical protein
MNISYNYKAKAQFCTKNKKNGVTYSLIVSPLLWEKGFVCLFQWFSSLKQITYKKISVLVSPLQHRHRLHLPRCTIASHNTAHEHNEGFETKITRNVMHLYSKGDHARNSSTVSPCLHSFSLRNVAHTNFYNEEHTLRLARHPKSSNSIFKKLGPSKSKSPPKITPLSPIWW